MWLVCRKNCCLVLIVTNCGMATLPSTSWHRNFWVRDARNSQAEVDFLMRYRSHLLPIEVKAGSNSKLKSLHLFMEESSEKVALRLWNGPMSSDVIARQDKEPFTLYNIPLYYAGHLAKFLDGIVW